MQFESNVNLTAPVDSEGMDICHFAGDAAVERRRVVPDVDRLSALVDEEATFDQKRVKPKRDFKEKP